MFLCASTGVAKAMFFVFLVFPHVSPNFSLGLIVFHRSAKVFSGSYWFALVLLGKSLCMCPWHWAINSPNKGGTTDGGGFLLILHRIALRSRISCSQSTPAPNNLCSRISGSQGTPARLPQLPIACVPGFPVVRVPQPSPAPNSLCSRISGSQGTPARVPSSQ